MDYLWNRITWQIDMAVYHLFYWRWSPRLKRDPNLAYIFSKVGAAWTNSNPPENPNELDEFLVSEFVKYGKTPRLSTDGNHAGTYITFSDVEKHTS